MFLRFIGVHLGGPYLIGHPDRLSPQQVRILRMLPVRLGQLFPRVHSPQPVFPMILRTCFLLTTRYETARATFRYP
ncbi:hypothetical protein C5O22_10285 [Treponema sp. J25]|nr:hypothetical protein C5O22_10285 [Treponema sp. J25]